MGKKKGQAKGNAQRVARAKALVRQTAMQRHKTAIFKRHKKRGGFLPLIPLIGGLASMFLSK